MWVEMKGMIYNLRLVIVKARKLAKTDCYIGSWPKQIQEDKRVRGEEKDKNNDNKINNNNILI